MYTNFTSSSIRRSTPIMLKAQNAGRFPAMWPLAVPTGDRFVLFGAQDAQRAKQKADQTYEYYKSLPLSEEAFDAKVNTILEDEKKDTSEEVSDNQKRKIQDKLLKHIVNQWINVSELYFEAVKLGNDESIVPKSPAFEAPVDLPGLTRELAREIRNDPLYRSQRGIHQKAETTESP